MNTSDLVARWDVALPDKVYKVSFEHGTTSGKRIIWVNDKEVLRKNWMFKLVGREQFKLGNTVATINIDAAGGFAYEYSLEVNGKSLKKFVENRKKSSKTWAFMLAGEPTRIVFEKDSLDVWVNGEKLNTAGEFVEDGTETHFTYRNHNCYIKAISSGKKKDGIIHALIVDGEEIPTED